MSDTHESRRDDMWDVIETFDFCMLTTHDTIDGEKLMRSRPMASYPDRAANRLRFLSKRTDDKVEEVNEARDVCLNFARPDDNRFVSVSGRATMTTDRALIEELWGPAAEIWFGGEPETADVAVIEVEPVAAEYWKKDETAFTRMAEMAKGYFTDEPPEIGENAKVDMERAA